MNYYEVAPLTKTTNKGGVFTYQHPDNIEVCTAVKIPVRNTSHFGIVIKKITKPSFETKTIVEISNLGRVIDDQRIEMAYFIAENYFCSLGEVLSAYLPFSLSVKKRRTLDLENTAKVKLSDWPKLSGSQQKIYDEIGSSNSARHLIFGVTGSGKTEIYLNLVRKALAEGNGSIVLIPEISLTPQVLDQFKERFPDNVAILHSDMKETEKFMEWEMIRTGQKRIVVGTRSAIFAPVTNLGLVIIDEFHENSYKQDQKPRYQTVTVAEKLIELYEAKLVLGSATPTVEKLYEANEGEYLLHLLNKRFIQTAMPDVEVVDMRHEFEYGNKSIFSEALKKQILSTLNDKRQILLFINRRGMSTFVSCRECGYVAKCPSCEIPLTFHYDDLSLRCHHCEFSTKPPTICPSCSSSAIKYFGTGTQRVEQELGKLIGSGYKIARMDKDTTKVRGSHDEIFKDFKNHKINVLIGTQMITKGWDLANVGLVGIITADALINFPDYNAHERALSLMIQVAGRTGRGNEVGKVIVQTYMPDLPIFNYLRKHDFLNYYQEELKERETLGYPPFTKLVKMLYNNSSEELARKNTEEAADMISKYVSEKNIDAKVLGPSPAFIPRLRSSYRWQIIIKVAEKKPQELSTLNNYLLQNFNNNWSIDSEPNGVM